LRADIVSLNRWFFDQRLFQAGPGLAITYLGQIGLLFVGLTIWASGASSAEIIALLALVMFVASRVVPALSRLSANISGITRSAPNVRMLAALISNIPAERAATSRVNRLSNNWATIRFENVSLKYPGRAANAVESVFVELQRGQRYCIVGQSGAGKSSLLNLLTGLVEPTTGRIFVDGVELSSINMNEWLSGIGYVAQSPHILDDTIRNNITFGEPASDDDEVWSAIRAARLEDVVIALDWGLDTKIGKGGTALSGGQFQRLAIARALHRQPNILILDEASSALDSATEQAVFESVLKYYPSMMIVSVTHRTERTVAFDQVIAMENGRSSNISRLSDALG
jgi:ATP-binding cassette subfamily C protein